jgi:hypothetical protein
MSPRACHRKRPRPQLALRAFGGQPDFLAGPAVAAETGKTLENLRVLGQSSREHCMCQLNFAQEAREGSGGRPIAERLYLAVSDARRWAAACLGSAPSKHRTQSISLTHDSGKTPGSCRGLLRSAEVQTGARGRVPSGSSASTDEGQGARHRPSRSAIARAGQLNFRYLPGRPERLEQVGHPGR